jgi:hypothetical protein
MSLTRVIVENGSTKLPNLMIRHAQIVLIMISLTIKIVDP